MYAKDIGSREEEKYTSYLTSMNLLTFFWVKIQDTCAWINIVKWTSFLSSNCASTKIAVDHHDMRTIPRLLLKSCRYENRFALSHPEWTIEHLLKSCHFENCCPILSRQFNDLCLNRVATTTLVSGRQLFHLTRCEDVVNAPVCAFWENHPMKILSKFS